jgi:glycosyltransferase involved in cell wall biosynthesis
MNLKLLMVSYTSFIQKFYQTLPHEVARMSGWNVKVLVPPYWRELWSDKRIYLEKEDDKLYDVQVGVTYFTGNLHLAFFRTRLKWLLQTFQPDIIDLENETFNLGSLQLCLYRNRYSPHSKIVLHASQHRYTSYPPPFNIFEKYLLKKTDAILARNKMAVEVLEKKGYRGLLKIVTHGVNTSAFSPRDLPELRAQLSPEKKPVVGYIGALEYHKGIHILLKAVAGLDIKLILIGSGSYQPQLRELAREQGVDVRFMEAATHEEVAQYLNCMDIFVLPSISRPNWVEKFGRVLIEAMASGVAVIGSASGEIPAVIKKCGLTFPEGDAAALRKKIQLLLKDSRLRGTLGWKGRKMVQREYSWKKIARQTIDVYRKIVADGARGLMQD